MEQAVFHPYCPASFAMVEMAGVNSIMFNNILITLHLFSLSRKRDLTDVVSITGLLALLTLQRPVLQFTVLLDMLDIIDPSIAFALKFTLGLFATVVLYCLMNPTDKQVRDVAVSMFHQLMLFLVVVLVLQTYFCHIATNPVWIDMVGDCSAFFGHKKQETFVIVRNQV